MNEISRRRHSSNRQVQINGVGRLSADTCSVDSSESRIIKLFSLIRRGDCSSLPVWALSLSTVCPVVDD